ncbi:MAG TPA: GAF domain-containing protein [Anaerolineae bacterium]|nr:GAF domain-containing protein [Anaerolineae bacterium]HQI84018.1 GAF domain-containing protein [Anaerolineae bacterium]
MQTQTVDQLYATLEKQQRRLEALRSVGLRVSRSLDFEWIIQQAVEEVCNALGVEAAAISIVDPERDELVIRAQRGLKSFAHEPVHLPKGIGLAWETLLHRETIIINSWENEPRLATPAFLEEHIRTTILVPMFTNGNPVGVLSAMTRENHSFTPDEQTMLTGIADQVAIALLNARLYEQTRRQSQERTFLFNLAASIAPLKNIDQIAHQVLEQTLHYLEWPVGVLLIEDSESNALVPQAQVGYTSALEALIARTESIVQRGDSHLTLTNDDPTHVLGTIIHIPLQTRQHILGWLAVGTQETVEVAKHTTETLVAEGNYLGVALENIQLYRKMIERERSSGILHALSRAMTGHNILQMLQQMLEELSKGLPYEVAGVLLTDPALQVLRYQHRMSAEQRAAIVSRLYAFLDMPENFGATLAPESCVELQAAEEPVKLDRPLAYLEVPIIQEERTIGGILLARPNPFVAHEQQLLFTIAYQLGKAIVATRLFHQAQEQANQLQEVNRLLKEQEIQCVSIFDDIAREMHNPVTFMQSYPELLLDGALGPLNEAQSQALTSIQQQAELLARLVRDLGAMKVAEPGKLQLQRIEVTGILHKVIESAQTAIKKKHITLQVACDDDLPAVRIDPDRIYQVIEQLLNNAIRFTPDNGTICLSAKRESEAAIRIAVSDTGPEIPKNEIDLIFKRLYHGKLERTYPGIGIDLALARRIVESHGGVIGVASDATAGNTFYITLPVQVETESLPAAITS